MKYNADTGGWIFPTDMKSQELSVAATDAALRKKAADNLYGSLIKTIDLSPAGSDMLRHCEGLLPMVDLIRKQAAAELDAARKAYEEHVNRL